MTTPDIDAPRAPLFAEPRLSTRSDGLDLVRGVLALWVLLTHLARWGYDTTGVPDTFRNTFQWIRWFFQNPEQTHPAVLGFVVLSGYCIHRNGLRTFQHDVPGWLIRRFFRIMPVYVLACLVGVALYSVDLRVNPELAATLTATREVSLGWVLVQISTISSLVPSLHAGSLQGNPPLATVMAEVWMYLLYPLVFWLVLRGFGRVLPVVLLVVWSGTVAAVDHYAVGPSSLPSWWDGGSAVNFALFWWVGARFVQPKALGASRFAPWVVLAIWLVTSVVLIQDWTASRFLVGLRCVAWCALFGVGLRWLEGKDGVLVRLGAVVGRASYSIYALHAPVLVALLLYGVPWWAAGLLTLGAGFLCHHLFELPMIRVGARVLARRG